MTTTATIQSTAAEAYADFNAAITTLIDNDPNLYAERIRLSAAARVGGKRQRERLGVDYDSSDPRIGSVLLADMLRDMLMERVERDTTYIGHDLAYIAVNHADWEEIGLDYMREYIEEYLPHEEPEDSLEARADALNDTDGEDE